MAHRIRFGDNEYLPPPKSASYVAGNMLMAPGRHPRIVEVLRYLEEFVGKEVFAVSDCSESIAVDISNPANPGIVAHVVASDGGHIPVTLMLSNAELGRFE